MDGVELQAALQTLRWSDVCRTAEHVLWIMYLGNIAHREGWVGIIHRTDRCDWSLFRLGLALLEHLLNEDLSIPVAFNSLEC